MISLITPCFNSEKTIEATIRSVYEQTYTDFEYIIIDGGSNDNTVSIIKKWIPLFEGRLSYISEADKGIYDAMNKGINMAQGDLIGIVNSDDWYEKNTVELITKHYTGADYEVVYGMQRTVSESKEVMVFIKNHEFLPDNMITHPTCFVTKKTYQDFGYFDLTYKSSADYDFMLRMFFNKKVKFTPIYSILSNFAAGGMSSGQVGVRENARIKLKYGIISDKKSKFIIAKSHLYEILTKKK